MSEANRLLLELLEAALASAAPEACLPPHLPPPPAGRTVVVGAGKASAAMAQVVEDAWPGPLSGLVITRYGHAAACTRIEIVEAGHPLPDAAGERAARRILELVSGLGPDDLVLCLLSGGGSALLALPAAGLTLANQQAVAEALLRSGAAIDEMNTVRKHLSAIKGGRLAVAAHPARCLALVVSDVPGDDLAVIASGPTVADPSTFADARAVVAKYAIGLPPAVRDHLAAGADETPKPGEVRLGRSQAVLIATPAQALAAAAARAEALGLTPAVLGDRIEGEAREVGRAHAALAREASARGPRTVLLSGGEVTVTLTGQGRGGPNAEYLLALALALDGAPGVHALACDTDGSDGSEDNAGAVIGPDTLARAAALGIDARARLADNDSYGFFDALGDLVMTGPTRTNLSDFRAILVEPAAA